MPAKIYTTPFQVQSGETLKYVEVSPDGTVGPVVTQSYAELDPPPAAFPDLRDSYGEPLDLRSAVGPQE